MFVHLRSHSYFSFLRGLPSPLQLTRSAAEQGMPALALTDHNSLTGAIEFSDACVLAKVKPIIGLEMRVSLPSGLLKGAPANDLLQEERDGELVFLAMDLAGWRSLCRLSSALLTDPQFIAKNQMPFERVAGESEGLICLTGGQNGILARLIHHQEEDLAMEYLHELAEIFPGRFYVELHRQSQGDVALSNRLAELAKQQRAPVVATRPIFYLKPEEAGLQRVVSAIRLNSYIKEVPAGELAPSTSWFVPADEMARLFEDVPQSLEATAEIAGRCQLELPLGAHHFPEVTLPAGITPAQALREKALAGAKRLYGTNDNAVQARLEHELSAIEERGYAPLFLIMQDILNFTRSADIPTASRGSASSSLVAHCLGITTPDPIRLDLYFERFLNPARSTPPDIDTDLCSRRRDDVIRYVYQTYGEDRVAMVGTINRFRSRSALREVAKVYGLPPAEIKTMADGLPYRGWGPPRSGRPAGASPYEGLQERFRSPLHKAIFRDALALREIPHHLSIHAGGLVIAPGSMVDFAPTMLASKGLVITQFDLDSIERLGLIKIDLLGIRGLSVLGDVAEGISQKSSPTHASRLSVLEAIPQDDPETAELVRNGGTIGCFQIESPGMRATLREIQADSVDDILAALALYRPGPLTGGLKDAFVRRHLGLEPVAHLHPALGSLLQDTYGVVLYQEQVLRIAHGLAGFSLAEADLLRRAMSHFDPGRQMQTLKEKFIQGAADLHDIPAETAERVWELMAAFAGYGFPKAHAASYALVAWRSAWCKAHHPAEFMAAVLANWGGYYSQRVYLMEARRMGLTVRPPHVNYSRLDFSVHYDQENSVLYMGLDQVRDLTHRTQRRIIQERPFSSLLDFLGRADPRPLEVQNLVEVGAFAGMGNIPTLLRQLNSSGRRRGQLSLFSLGGDEAVSPEGELDWSPAEKAAGQETILGINVEYHPLELAAEKLSRLNATSTLEAATQIGQRVRVAGVRQTWRRAQTGRGEAVYLMALEDLEGVLNVVISSDVYRRCRAAIIGKGLLVVEGVVELDAEAGEIGLRAEKIFSIEVETYGQKQGTPLY